MPSGPFELEMSKFRRRLKTSSSLNVISRSCKPVGRSGVVGRSFSVAGA